MAEQTAVEYFDEQIQERIIAQDVVARKMIIEISMEDYINIKKQAKQMEKQQMHKIAEYWHFNGIADEYFDDYYDEIFGK